MSDPSRNAGPARLENNGHLSIRYFPVDELKPNPANPRRHEPAQLRRLAKIIKKFGFRVPILVDRTRMIIAGHARCLAAPVAGLTEVPTILVDDLTDAEIKAFMIADNRMAELSTWDDKVLAEQLLELSNLSPDLSLELTGFEVGEIDLRIESLNDPADVAEPDEGDIMPVSAGPPVTKLGDAWILDRHKIHCADARGSASYIALMAAERASAAFTDPPFNVRIDGHASGLGKSHHREFAMATGEMSEAEFTEFLTQALRHLITYTVDDAIIYQCIDWRHLWEAMGAARAAGCELINFCVWVKHNGGMGSLYRSQHELVLVLKHGRGSHVNNVQLGRFGRNRTNVWQYRGANDFGRGEGEGNLLALHPTPKPVAMVADAIMDCTQRGDIVLDAFLGSGTTLIAAERVGRRCYALELDPLYVDTAVRRWQKLTGGVARHASSGISFDEIAAGGEVRHGE
jgi:DNA modification methylase